MGEECIAYSYKVHQYWYPCQLGPKDLKDEGKALLRQLSCRVIIVN